MISPTGKNRHRGGLGSVAGFSLIEVLIAVVVLSIGIVLALQGLHAIMSVWDGAVGRLRTTLLVQEVLQDTRREAASSVPVAGSGRCSVPFEDYRWRTEVESAAGMMGVDGGGLYRIRGVVWRDDENRETALSTLIFSPPPPTGSEEGQGAP